MWGGKGVHSKRICQRSFGGGAHLPQNHKVWQILAEPINVFYNNCFKTFIVNIISFHIIQVSVASLVFKSLVWLLKVIQPNCDMFSQPRPPDILDYNSISSHHDGIKDRSTKPNMEASPLERVLLKYLYYGPQKTIWFRSVAAF